VDTRHASEFAAGHLPGTINLPLGRSFTTWAGSVLPYGRDFYLIVEDASEALVEEVVRDLAMIGLDRVAGCFSAGVVENWAGHRAVQGISEVSVDQLASLLAAGAVEVIDVRNSSEWEAGHIPGSLNLPLGRLTEALERIPRGRPLVVHCQTGPRSAVAVGVLQANGFQNVSQLSGDFAEWAAQRQPIEKATGAEVASTPST
jgi:hydroxyacylglutathione hydrolase